MNRYYFGIFSLDFSFLLLPTQCFRNWELIKCDYEVVYIVKSCKI